jgi:acyl carrier protein
LAEHSTDVAPTTVYEPADAWERTVAECWTELVGQQPRDATESFFEAGGHSLLSIRLIAALEERSGHRIDLRSVFAAPSVPGIAAALRAREEQGGNG